MYKARVKQEPITFPPVALLHNTCTQPCLPSNSEVCLGDVPKLLKLRNIRISGYQWLFLHIQ